MKTLGIDPGTARLGYGVIDESASGDPYAVAFGVITTEAGDEMPARLSTLFDYLTGLLQEHQPDVLAVEQLFCRRFRSPFTVQRFAKTGLDKPL